MSALALIEYLFLSSKLISPKVLFSPSGINIGSQPNPFSPLGLTISPSIEPSKYSSVPSSLLKPTIHLAVAFGLPNDS